MKRHLSIMVRLIAARISIHFSRTKIILVSLVLTTVGTFPIRLLAQEPEVPFKQGMEAEKNGDYATAIADYTLAIQADPKFEPSYSRRAAVYVAKTNYDKAIADLNEVIQLNPKNAVAYNDLAWLLATSPQDNLRDGKKAVEYANLACQLSDWKARAPIDTLAAAYAESGDFESAMNWENKILSIPHLPEAAEANAQSRLKLYELRQPYRMAK